MRDKTHNPLLFIAGSMDKSQPPIINIKKYKKYSDKNSITDFKMFEGRTHNILNQENWIEVTDYIKN